MKNKLPYLLACLSATVLLATTAHGATIASFDFAAGSASSSDTEPLTTTSVISAAGSGLSGINLVSDQLQVGGDQTSGSRDTAVASNVYFSFSIDAPAAATLSLDQIDFDFGYVNKFGYRIQLRGSADNFASDLWTVVDIIQSGSTTVAARNVDLSAISGYQDVSDDTIEFRFYVGDGSGSATRYAIFDNISVTGTATAIPEPSAALLGGLGLLALLRRRR